MPITELHENNKTHQFEIFTVNACLNPSFTGCIKKNKTKNTTIYEE